MLKEAINAQNNRSETRFLENYAAVTMLNQMSSKSGTLKSVEKELQSLLKDLMQIEDDNMIMPVNFVKLSRE